MGGVESQMGPLGGVLLFNLLTAWPLWRIFARAGLPPWWSLAAFIPLAGYVLTAGLLCHARWPNLPERGKPAPRKQRRVVSGRTGGGPTGGGRTGGGE